MTWKSLPENICNARQSLFRADSAERAAYIFTKKMALRGLRERERARVEWSERVKACEWERVCVCVCVREREREKKKEWSSSSEVVHFLIFVFFRPWQRTDSAKVQCPLSPFHLLRPTPLALKPKTFFCRHKICERKDRLIRRNKNSVKLLN